MWLFCAASLHRSAKHELILHLRSQGRGIFLFDKLSALAADFLAFGSGRFIGEGLRREPPGDIRTPVFPTP